MAAVKRKETKFGKDRRRKHHLSSVTVYYGDGETSERIYVDLAKARCFAARQKKSPVVKRTRVTRLS
jgi:uncharacterized Fe-S cluster-containing radical SAM superfamily protein